MAGKYHGMGKIQYPKMPFTDVAGSYEGCWVRGEKHGYGQEVYPNGDYYEGNFKAGYRSGIGKMIFGPGNSEFLYYEGEWEDH